MNKVFSLANCLVIRLFKDILKTRLKCLNVAEDYLISKKSFVIDNTCTTKKDRKAFIDLAKKYILIIIFYFNIINVNKMIRDGY